MLASFTPNPVRCRGAGISCIEMENTEDGPASYPMRPLDREHTRSPGGGGRYRPSRSPQPVEPENTDDEVAAEYTNQAELAQIGEKQYLGLFSTT